MDGGRAGLRVVRAAVFAGVSLSLSAGGQLLATGAPLPVATVLWAGLAVFLLALPLAARNERGYAGIAALLVPLELVLNATFNIGQASCGPGVPPDRALSGLPNLLLCGGGDLRGPAASPVGPGLLHLSLPSAPSAWQFALLLAESLTGARPVRHILPWLSQRGTAHLYQLLPRFNGGQGARIQRIMTAQPSPDVLEMTLIVAVGPRTRALAVRLARTEPMPQPQWRATLPAQTPDARSAASSRWLCTDIEAA